MKIKKIKKILKTRFDIICEILKLVLRFFGIKINWSKFNTNKNGLKKKETPFVVLDKICFGINTAILISHYKAIFQDINPKDFDILYIDTMPQKEIDLVKEFCKNIGCGCYCGADIFDSNVKYKTLITHHIGGLGVKNGVHIVKKVSVKTIRMIYGLGKNAWMFAKENSNFDFHLVYGEFSKRMTMMFFKEENKIFKIGYPRYDEAFKKSDEEIKKQLNIKEDEFIISWLPTHGENISSIPGFVKLISSLNGLIINGKKVKIIAKLHPMDSEENIKLLKENNILLIEDGLFNNSVLIKISDFIFCDYGGSMFGAVYMNKNLLLLNSLKDEYESESNKKFKVFKREDGHQISLDVEMRKKVVNIEKDISLNELLDLLKNKEIWDLQKKKLVELAQDLFEPYYGFSGKVAKEYIMAIHHQKINELSKKIQEVVKKNNFKN